MVRKAHISRAAIFVVLCAVTVLSACGPAARLSHGVVATFPLASPTATAPLQPTALTVMRFGGVLDSHVAPFQMSAHDVAGIQRLYQDTLALPLLPSYWGCRAPRAGYQLTFTNGNTIVEQVILSGNIGNCATAALSSPSDCRGWTAALPAQIADALGVSATTIEPSGGLANTAGPDGPFAPGAPTPPIIAPHCDRSVFYAATPTP